MKTLMTRYFDEVQIDENEILHFTTPIYGFEELTEYVLLYDDTSEDSPFCWLQSVDDAQVCFVIMDPTALCADYAPTLSDDTRAALSLVGGEQPVYRVMAVVPQDLSKATVNLKSPIVINSAKHCAAQVILEDDYPVRVRLMEAENESC